MPTGSSFPRNRCPSACPETGLSVLYLWPLTPSGFEFAPDEPAIARLVPNATIYRGNGSCLLLNWRRPAEVDIGVENDRAILRSVWLPCGSDSGCDKNPGAVRHIGTCATSGTIKRDRLCPFA